VASLLERAPLHATASLGPPAPLYQDCGLALAALGDPPVEPGATLGAHATFDVMSRLAVLVVHPDQSAASSEFVPAETSG
jgi:hypothetical protein